MTVRTPSKQIKELDVVDPEEMEHEASSDDEDLENNEEMASDEDNENEEGDESEGADNEFDDNESNDEPEYDDEEGNSGWANAFAKVLQQEKPKNKKYLVLSKAKKLADQKEKCDNDKKSTFEIAGKNDVSDEDVKPDIVDEDNKPTNNELDLALIARKEQTNKLLQLRVKPGSMDRERERAFKRISTKGVVQLFNAVRSQQRDLVDRIEKAGPLDHKRDEVLNNINKRQFLDMLMGGKRAKSENIDNPVKNEKDADEEGSRPSQWTVLRDDFMTNKKLKHWDKEEDDDGSDQAVDNDIDSDSD